MNRLFYFHFFLVFLAAIVPGWAVTPMDYYNSLVAGGGDAGFRDGTFASARFNYPTGLAVDEAGNHLYVADEHNNRIRVVDLNQNNEVKTLAGTGLTGAVDGPLLLATFNAPTKLALLPGDRLIVFDGGNSLLRLIDLQQQTVSTIAKSINVLDMVYRPQDDSLYFSAPDQIEKLNMKSLAISKVFSNNPQVPSPGAICIYQDNLCVADRSLPTIYEVKLDNAQSPTPVTVSVSLSAVGNAKDVLALSSSDGFLYALQKGGFLLKVGLSDSSIVKLPTPWGFLFKNQDHGLTFFNIQADIPVGFSASPSEPRKFYISTEHSIVSVKDYDFENFWGAMEDNSRVLSDFNYPAQKPPRTFRILVTGSSRNSTAVQMPADPTEGMNEDVQSPKVFTYSKQLEFLLNTEAALRNSRIHFEVLNLTRRGEALSNYTYYEVPDLVKKYDVDLVLGLADLSGYRDYYLSPMTSEGIPAQTFKHDYTLKPLSERAPSGPASDLLERCKKLKIPVSEKQDYPGDGAWSLFCNGDQQIQDDLKEMTGRRLQLLQDKLNSMKTSEGNNPQLIFFYIPCPGFPNDCLMPFWNDVCARYHFKFFDTTESYDALKVSYYPADVIHLTTYGNELIARILDHYLVENKFIPFEANQK